MPNFELDNKYQIFTKFEVVNVGNTLALMFCPLEINCRWRHHISPTCKIHAAINAKRR